MIFQLGEYAFQKDFTPEELAISTEYNITEHQNLNGEIELTKNGVTDKNIPLTFNLYNSSYMSHDAQVEIIEELAASTEPLLYIDANNVKQGYFLITDKEIVTLSKDVNDKPVISKVSITLRKTLT